MNTLSALIFRITHSVLIALVAVVCVAPLLAPREASGDCSLTSIGVTPLSDSAGETYRGRPGGLYPGGFSTRPPAHLASAMAIAEGLSPLDAAGSPDPRSGRIVMTSVGMSNATQEFSHFVSSANRPDSGRNPQLTIVDGAQGARTAHLWADPSDPVWDVVDARLAAAGVTPAQVQVAWIKNAEGAPVRFGDFPTHAEVLQGFLEDIARNLRTHYPNIVLAYYSSRTRAYDTDPNGLNSEPWAFESGFSVRWTIESQLQGTGNLEWNAAVGPVVAPLLQWGPYIWVDGLDPRSDGLQWACSDLQNDFVHPSATGRAKVSDQLMAFFKTDPTTAPWFLDDSPVGAAPSCNATASPPSGPAGLTVSFAANASDTDGQVIETAWSFADGTSSMQASPTKIFHADDTYEAHLTVTDEDGNPTRCATTVLVPETETASLGLTALFSVLAVAHLRRQRASRDPHSRDPSRIGALQ